MAISREELEKLAKAVIEEALTFNEPSCGEPHYFCVFCNAELHGYIARRANFVHENDCPVLTAEKIIGGAI